MQSLVSCFLVLIGFIRPLAIADHSLDQARKDALNQSAESYSHQIAHELFKSVPSHDAQAHTDLELFDNSKYPFVLPIIRETMLW